MIRFWKWFIGFWELTMNFVLLLCARATSEIIYEWTSIFYPKIKCLCFDWFVLVGNSFYYFKSTSGILYKQTSSMRLLQNWEYDFVKLVSEFWFKTFIWPQIVCYCVLFIFKHIIDFLSIKWLIYLFVTLKVDKNLVLILCMKEELEIKCMECKVLIMQYFSWTYDLLCSIIVWRQDKPPWLHLRDKTLGQLYQTAVLTGFCHHSDKEKTPVRFLNLT